MSSFSKKVSVGSIKIKLIVIVSLIALCSCLLIGIIFNAVSVNALEEEVKGRLEDNAIKSADVVAARVSAQQRILDSVSHGEAMLDKDLTIAEKVDSLKVSAAADAQFGILRYGIANMQGRTIMTNGNTSDVSERDYFKAAMRGERFVTTPMLAKSDGTWIIV